MKHRVNVCVAGLASWLLLGCDEPLKSVELIAEARVLGARVEVSGDAGRAAPAPGESASVAFLVAAPELQPALGFALSVCPAAPRRGTRGACAGPSFAEVSAPEGQAMPSLDFDVPADLDPSGRLLVQGRVCPQGSPNADATSCDGPEPGTPVQLELELAHDGDVNLNPELDPAGIAFDSEPWPDLPAVDGDCADLGFPEVGVKTKHQLTVTLDDSARDALPRPSSLDPARESLQLSHFTTAGDLARAFDSIAADAGIDELTRRVAWTAPSAPGLVRFWFVLRDFRGGSAFTERALCVR